MKVSTKKWEFVKKFQPQNSSSSFKNSSNSKKAAFSVESFMGFGNKTRFERCIFYEHQMDKKVTTPVGNSCSILEKNGTDAKISTSWVFECYGWLMLLDIDLWFVRIAQWIRRFSNALCIFEIISNFNCISSLTFTFLTKYRMTYTYEFMRTFNRKRYSL